MRRFRRCAGSLSLALLLTLLPGVNPAAEKASGQAPAVEKLITGILLLDAVNVNGRLLVVGERGRIFIRDAGTPWRLAQTPASSATLTTVFMADEQTGWAAGHDAVILKTTDGGQSWREVYSDPEREAPILDLWFADRDYGLAVGAYGLYLVTTNGGENWTDTGLRVVNAGEWEEPGADGLEPDDPHLNAIAADAAGHLYLAAEAGHLYHSEDSGQTWAALPAPYHGSFFGVLPMAEDSLLAFGLRGHLYRSDDGGASWVRIMTGTDDTLTAGLVRDDGSIVLTGMGGALLTSHDSGRDFALRKLPREHGYAAAAKFAGGDLLLVGDHGVEILRRDARPLP